MRYLANESEQKMMEISIRVRELAPKRNDTTKFSYIVVQGYNDVYIHSIKNPPCITAVTDI